MTNIKETYLGDGVYASDDGQYIKLRAEGIPKDNEVYLDENVLLVFIDYVNKLKTYGEEDEHR